MFRIIYAGTGSACFELNNRTPFEAPERYAVDLDGAQVLESDTNVFSLFGLVPGKEYEVCLRMGGRRQALHFETKRETCAFDVKDFGAVGDGKSDDTAAIQRAIALLPEGGRLVFSPGCYLTGPILLKSHMTLELCGGATLLGLVEKAKYPIIPAMVRDIDSAQMCHFGGFEGLPRDMYASLITAQYARDITIVGPGMIDGNAQNGTWWQTFKQDPVARPRLCFFNRCEDVVLHGIQAANSASWQLHPYYSKQVRFYDISVTAPKQSPNTDALDPECCDGVEIIGCRFSVGDDCIAIKSGKLELAKMCPAPAANHIIRNCLMAFGHGAVTLGSEISGGVKNLSVTQCLFRQTDRGLRIKTRRGRGKGCDIDQIAFDNIRMEGVITPIVMNMWYNCVDPDGNSDYVQGRAPIPVDERTPRLGRFRFSNMDCSGAEAAACYCDGLPEQPIEAVTLENVHISFSPEAAPFVPAMQRDAQKRCRMGLYFDNVRHVTLKNVQVEGHEGDEVVTGTVDEIRID